MFRNFKSKFMVIALSLAVATAMTFAAGCTDTNGDSTFYKISSDSVQTGTADEADESDDDTDDDSTFYMISSDSMQTGTADEADESDDDTDGEDEQSHVVIVEDTQTIRNGNFEFFHNNDDGTYIIYTPNNWSSTTSGNTNYVMNGIVDTSENGWTRLADPELVATLDYNNSLDKDDDDYEDKYVDYNGMKSKDIPYKDTYNALNSDAYKVIYTGYDSYGSYYYILDGNDNEIQVIPTGEEGVYTDENMSATYYEKQLVDNPLTHNVITAVAGEDYDAYYIADTDETHGKTEYAAGDTVYLYADEEGNYFYDEECEYAYESHVLMIHNYVNDDYRYGTARSYTSSTTVTLQAGTAAELTVWVKTSELIYGRYGMTVDEGRGAYIRLEQTAGGTAADPLYIENIRTDGVTENNGWVKYTIYVTGSTDAESTITLTVGLGQAESSSEYSETCEGYAFFDDIKCTIYSEIGETTYNETVSAGIDVNECTLSGSAEEKIFSVDDFDNGILDEKSRYYHIDLSV